MFVGSFFLGPETLGLRGATAAGGYEAYGFSRVANVSDIGNTRGIYIFSHTQRGGLPYVGETGQFATRIAQHTADGAYTRGELWFKAIPNSSQLARQVEETQMMINLGGKSKIANLRWSVGPVRNVRRNLGITGY